MKVIINPTSGNGRALKAWKRFKKHLNKNGIEHEFYFTEYMGHGLKIIDEIGVDDGDKIIAIGGDGTVNEIANSIINSKKDLTLGIIAQGTGNDIAASFGIPTSFEEQVQVIHQENVQLFDAGRVNNRFFFGVLSVGFDAEVARRTNEGAKWLPGTFNYVKSLLITLKELKTYPVEISIDDEMFLMKKYILLAFGNGYRYGGGMKICPHSRLDDGKISIVGVNTISRTTLLKVFPRVYKGTHVSHPMVDFYEGKRIKLKTDNGALMQADGEILGPARGVVEAIPGAIKVFAPRNNSRDN